MVAVDDHQTIRILQGGQPVGNGEGGSALREPPQSLLDQVFALRVQTGGGLVQNQQPRIAQYRSGDGDPLPLAS